MYTKHSNKKKIFISFFHSVGSGWPTCKKPNKNIDFVFVVVAVCANEPHSFHSIFLQSIFFFVRYCCELELIKKCIVGQMAIWSATIPIFFSLTFFLSMLCKTCARIYNFFLIVAKPSITSLMGWNLFLMPSFWIKFVKTNQEKKIVFSEPF